MKFLFPLLLLFTFFDAKAQKDTVVLTRDESLNIDTSKTVFNNTHVIMIDDAKSRKLISESDYVNNKLNGWYVVYNNDGKVWWRATYKDGKRDGFYVENNDVGNTIRKEQYAMDVFIAGLCYDDSGKQIPFFARPVFYAERMPVFHNLGKYIDQELRYPTTAKIINNGSVILRIVIMSDGAVKYPKVVRSLNPDCDAEAVRLVSNMPKWKPAMQDGKPVNAYYNIAIPFKKNDG